MLTRYCQISLPGSAANQSVSSSRLLLQSIVSRGWAAKEASLAALSVGVKLW